MSSEPKRPYYRECPDCGGHEIKTMWKTPNDVDYEYCSVCRVHRDMGSFLVGPGINPRTTDAMAVYNNYFGDCCTICGEKETKTCGYTERGKGIPFRLCKKHRNIEEMPEHRIRYRVKTRDDAYFNRHQIAKERDLEIAQKKKNMEKMGVKKPVVGRTGKTARKRARKS